MSNPGAPEKSKRDIVAAAVIAVAGSGEELPKTSAPAKQPVNSAPAAPPTPAGVEGGVHQVGEDIAPGT